jgi:hypothetical protein
MIFADGIFEGWNWDTHPVYFGYAAVLVAALWLVWRLLLSVERLTGRDVRPQVDTVAQPQTGAEPGESNERTDDGSGGGVG